MPGAWTIMNIKHIESVVQKKLCPVCGNGMTREIEHKVYRCDHARCGETFNFSLLSDAMIQELLAKKRDSEMSREKSTK